MLPRHIALGQGLPAAGLRIVSCQDLLHLRQSRLRVIVLLRFCILRLLRRQQPGLQLLQRLLRIVEHRHPSLFTILPDLPPKVKHPPGSFPSP